MALGVTFPKNEDVVAFERKNEMLVLLVSKSGTYKKELGNYAGYWLRKMYWKDLHCRGMQISRNALTHVLQNFHILRDGEVDGKMSKWQNNCLTHTLNPVSGSVYWLATSILMIENIYVYQSSLKHPNSSIYLYWDNQANIFVCHWMDHRRPVQKSQHVKRIL